MRISYPVILFAFVIQALDLHAAVSPIAVGWGNMFVPGLGATLRGSPGRGLLEAGIEIGVFYGGTFGVREGAFTIDTTIIEPQRGNLYRPLIGKAMQQFGLKFHMYNTFYHYQQASLEVEASGEKLQTLQPLYRGSTADVLTAPFQWKYLSSPWVYSLLLVSAAYLVYDYHTTSVKPSTYRPTSTEEGLYGFYNVAAEPFGSAFGEEPLFRGFIMREFNQYTGSFWLSLLMQSTLFTLLHPEDARLPAFIGGTYLGYLVHHFEGDLGPAIAAHFWINFTNGLAQYFKFRVAHGKDVPFGPPLGLVLGMPL